MPPGRPASVTQGFFPAVPVAPQPTGIVAAAVCFSTPPTATVTAARAGPHTATTAPSAPPPRGSRPPAHLSGSHRRGIDASARWVRGLGRHSASVVRAALPLPLALHAANFNEVRGVVHDADHRPVAQAAVELRAVSSDCRHLAAACDRGFRRRALAARAAQRR